MSQSIYSLSKTEGKNNIQYLHHCWSYLQFLFLSPPQFIIKRKTQLLARKHAYKYSPPPIMRTKYNGMSLLFEALGKNYND